MTPIEEKLKLATQEVCRKLGIDPLRYKTYQGLVEEEMIRHICKSVLDFDGSIQILNEETQTINTIY